ncbi:MAG: VWA domain-containing protein, partial [Longimicrobiales bacterium]
MSLSSPWLLGAGPVVAILIVVGLVRLAARRRRLVEFLGGPRATRRLGRSGLGRIPTGRILLLSVAALCLAAAAAGPRWSEADEGADAGSRAERGVAERQEAAVPSVILAIDISASMQADDVDPTRLGRAAEIAGGLLETLEDSRVGLVLFSGTAYTLAPPTEDHEVLEYLLEGVSPELVNIYDPGSLPSAVLREAASYIARADSSAEPTAPGARSIVVIGDGEAGEPRASARDAVAEVAEAGIRIHTIGVGTAEGGRLVLPAGYTRKGVDGSGPSGPMVSRLDESALRQLASVGRGLYAHAEDPAALARIHRALDAGGAEPPPEPEGPLWARLDPGAILVGLALLLLLTESLMDA